MKLHRRKLLIGGLVLLFLIASAVTVWLVCSNRTVYRIHWTLHATLLDENGSPVEYATFTVTGTLTAPDDWQEPGKLKLSVTQADGFAEKIRLSDCETVGQPNYDYYMFTSFYYLTSPGFLDGCASCISPSQETMLLYSSYADQNYYITASTDPNISPSDILEYYHKEITSE